jgi:conjugal transfer mating pair stabilization protein TraN
MKRGFTGILALSLLAPALVFADAADDARAVGAAATRAISGNLSTQPARDMTPGYTANPSQTSISPLDVNSATAQLLAACQANTSDPSCEAILKAQSDSAVARATPAMTTDPSVLTALSQTKNPVLDGVAASYSNCGTNTKTTGGPVYTTQSCYNYFLRTVDQPCVKTMQVSVSWSCNPGADGLYTDASGNHYCNRLQIQYSCLATETMLNNWGTVTCQSTSSVPATDTLTLVSEPAILANGIWSCSVGAAGPYVDQGGNEYCNRASDQYSCLTGATLLPDPSIAGSWICQTTTTRPADATMILIQEAAVPTVNQWLDDSGCASYEALVPPGLLPPDGQNPVTGGAATGSANKCERTTSVCSDASPITRIFDTVPVTNACWQYTNTFSCVTLDAASDCSQPRWGQCQTQGALVCVDYDAIDPSICTAQRQDYSCLTGDTTQTQSTVNCAGQSYTDPSGVQWNTGHTPNQDFGTTVAYLEAAREGGMYMSGTPSALELFKGFDNRCVKKLFGLVNCCNKTGGVNFQAFSNYSVMLSAAKGVGQAAASTYTYDALYASDAPGWVMQGFTAMFDQGYQSMFAGFLAGDVSAVDLLVDLVPGPWTIAIMVIQYSGILSCPQNQQITSIKRGAGLCVDLGDYCSNRLKWIHTCIERTQTACCFNSKLAKAINVQGKAQLGRSMGWAQSPNCSGFTPDDFSHLDLSKMDFSEFMNDVHAQAVDVSSTASRANPTTCYYGNGKCN